MIAVLLCCFAGGLSISTELLGNILQTDFNWFYLVVLRVAQREGAIGDRGFQAWTDGGLATSTANFRRCQCERRSLFLAGLAKCHALRQPDLLLSCCRAVGKASAVCHRTQLALCFKSNAPDMYRMKGAYGMSDGTGHWLWRWMLCSWLMRSSQQCQLRRLRQERWQWTLASVADLSVESTAGVASCVAPYAQWRQCLAGFSEPSLLDDVSCGRRHPVG